MRAVPVPHAVMPAPVAGIHVVLTQKAEDADGRDKPGHDAAMGATGMSEQEP
jgi:hypothetical protein